MTASDGQKRRGGEQCTRGEIVPLNLALSYPVRWSRFHVLRDFVQNFFDAVGPSDFQRRVRWRRRGAHLELSAEGVEYSHGWLSTIGASTKTAASARYAGYFGEGFKIAALCAFRDLGWGISAGSRDWTVDVVRRDHAIDGHPVPMLAYRLTRGASDDSTSWLRLDGVTAADERLLTESVIPSFCYPANPLFGQRLWGDASLEVWRRSSLDIPAEYPRSRQGSERGILFYSRQALGTHELPFVFAAHDVRTPDRERSALYDFQVVDGLASIARRLPAELAGEVLASVRRRWGVCPRRKYEVGSWYPVVRNLCARLAAAPPAALAWRESHPSLAVAAPIGRRDIATGNRRRQALSWLARRGGGLSLVQDGFLALGYPRLEDLCHQAGGFAMTRDPETPWEKARVALLWSFVAEHFEDFFPRDRLPPLRVIRSPQAAWSGMAVAHRHSPSLLTRSGHRLRFRLEEVAVKARVLAEEEPFEAIASLLHELAHMVGGDGSKRFAYVLTDLIARVAALHDRHRDLLAAWMAASPEATGAAAPVE